MRGYRYKYMIVLATENKCILFFFFLEGCYFCETCLTYVVILIIVNQSNITYVKRHK